MKNHTRRPRLFNGLACFFEPEFDGDNAKLEWPVSIDGKKKQNETYKIIGILTKITTPDK